MKPNPMKPGTCHGTRLVVTHCDMYGLCHLCAMENSLVLIPRISCSFPIHELVLLRLVVEDATAKLNVNKP